MSELIKIILVILISSVKFVAGPPFATYFDKSIDFTYLETVLYCIIGGMLGVTVFSFFTPYLFMFWKLIKKLYYKLTAGKPLYSPPAADINGEVEIKYIYVESNKKKLFTPHNRRIVKIWRKYGLAGIAFFTPVLLSIPIGTIVATRLVHNKKKIFLYMFISIVFWSFTMNLFFEITSGNKALPGTHVQ